MRRDTVEDRPLQVSRDRQVGRDSVLAGDLSDGVVVARCGEGQPHAEDVRADQHT